MATESSWGSTVVTHEGGACFVAQLRSHRVIMDQPERGGGADSGPTPVELLGAALGGCIALYLQRFCSTRALDHAGMRVEVSHRTAANPSRVAAFEVLIVLPNDVPEPYPAMLERVARTCPVGNTLEGVAEISVRFQLGANRETIAL